MCYYFGHLIGSCADYVIIQLFSCLKENCHNNALRLHVESGSKHLVIDHMLRYTVLNTAILKWLRIHLYYLRSFKRYCNKSIPVIITATGSVTSASVDLPGDVLPQVPIPPDSSLIARFMGPTWGQLGPIGPMLAPCWPPWTLLSGMFRFFQ